MKRLQLHNRFATSVLLLQMIAASFFMVYATDAPGQVVLVFRDSSQINDSLIMLGDIADIRGGPADLRKAMARTIVGRSAPPGFSRFVGTGDIIGYRLAASFGKVAITGRGAVRVQVLTLCRKYRVGDFESEIRSYLDTAAGWKRGESEITITNPEEIIRCFNRPAAVSFGKQKEHFPKGNTIVILHVNQGAWSVKVPVHCRFTVSIPVVVARTAIARGELVTTDNCEVRTMDITHFSPNPLRTMSALAGKRASRTIRPGRILHDRMVKIIPVIEKGDPVAIEVRKGRISVSVAGIARERGGIGDRIWVENKKTNKLIRVQIRKKGSVTVLQGGVSI